MLEAWRRVFTGVSEPRIEQTETDAEVVARVAPNFGPMVAQARRDTPLVQIGDAFGGRDHSTVIHSIQKVEEDLQKDESFRNRVLTLRGELTA